MFRLVIIIQILALVLVGVLTIHNFSSINQDIGRHIKLGEIIWSTKNIPHTNLLSFTEPDFPFINHHWLSEVIFYWLNGAIGLKGMIIFKSFLIVFSFFLILRIINRFIFNSKLSDGTKQTSFVTSTATFLLLIFIFAERTEVRPEIFSFLIFSFYLVILFNAKHKEKYNQLWLLLPLQLLWVNLHIYFFIGPLLFLFFFIDRLLLRKANSFLFAIGILVGLVTLINPNFINGAIYPLNVFKEYGYDIAENKSPFFLEKFGPSLAIEYFKISLAVIIISFLLIVKRIRSKVFELLIAIFLIYAGIKMQRNFSIYSLGMLPIVAMNLTDFIGHLGVKKSFGWLKNLRLITMLGLIALITFLVFYVASNRYYENKESRLSFGLDIPTGAQGAVDFLQETGISGPMFNNFDIGSFLTWKLYPKERVFVDGRPEAYSLKFFSEIYKPMQEDKNKWDFYTKQYGINYIVFDHRDQTPWAGSFLSRISNDPTWPMVYIDDWSVIFLKNSSNNIKTINGSGKKILNNKNVFEGGRAGEILNSDDETAIKSLARFLSMIRWDESAIRAYDKVVKLNPQSAYSYLGLGYIFSRIQTVEAQEKSSENLKKAISLGLKSSDFYVLLGMVNYNLGRTLEAKFNWEDALKINPEDINAKKLLNQTFPTR